MAKLILLTVEQLELIHAAVLAKSGGLFGTRDPSTLKSLETKPLQAVFGKTLYPTIFQKAATYAYLIITQHPFADGNKRTGVMSALTFLEVNGYDIVATDDELFDLALHIVTKKPDVADIAEWFATHTQKQT